MQSLNWGIFSTPVASRHPENALFFPISALANEVHKGKFG
jgi:hypothetical protein